MRHAAVLALASLAAAGCVRTEEPEPDSRMVTIHVQSPIVASIATRSIINDATFSNTNGTVSQIGLALMNAGGTKAAQANIKGYHNIGVSFEGKGGTAPELKKDGAYCLSDGTIIAAPAVRRTAVLDIYGYYPYDSTMVDLEQIPFSVVPPAESMANTLAYPTDYMTSVPVKEESAEQSSTLRPSFGHAMSSIYLRVYTRSQLNSSYITISKITFTYKGSTDQPGRPLSGLPMKGTYSAVDGSVTVNERVASQEYKYTGKSFYASTICYFVFPEMLVAADNYPDDASIDITLTVNEGTDEIPQTQPFRHTYNLKLSAIAAGTKKGLVKGYQTSLSLYFADYRQFLLGEMQVTPWGKEDYTLDM